MIRQSVRKSKTIYVGLEGYLYLQNMTSLQRLGRPISEKHAERLKRNFNNFAYKGECKLHDRGFGGCVGNHVNGYEEGRWTSWSCDDMARILDEAHIKYRMGCDEEVIDISI